MPVDRLELKLRQAVRGLRAELGLTQAQLAERWGVTRDVVSNLETGGRALRAAELPSLCAALGVPVWRLFLAAEEDELLSLGFRFPPRVSDIDERPPPSEG